MIVIVDFVDIPIAFEMFVEIMAVIEKQRIAIFVEIMWKVVDFVGVKMVEDV